jgi:uncharacterized membrane protein YdbT with pleckstrin-like domain
MASIALPYPHQLTFRPFQPWLWLHIAALLLLNFGALALVIILHDLRWLALIVPPTLLIVVLICRYRAQAITINGASLTCRRGTLRVREVTIPIARVNYEIRQTFTGRLFDYGSVRVVTTGGVVEIRRIGSIRALQALIAERQTELYLLPYGWRPNGRR